MDQRQNLQQHYLVLRIYGLLVLLLFLLLCARLVHREDTNTNNSSFLVYYEHSYDEPLHAILVLLVHASCNITRMYDKNIEVSPNPLYERSNPFDSQFVFHLKMLSTSDI